MALYVLIFAFTHIVTDLLEMSHSKETTTKVTFNFCSVTVDIDTMNISKRERE